jgi:putative addiction module component (TIGR02574 family)
MADYRLGLADRAGVSRINDMATIEIANLSPEERLQLLDALWESLSATPEAIPLTSAQREELDRRLDELDREGPTGIPWDEVLRRIGCKSR